MHLLGVKVKCNPHPPEMKAHQEEYIPTSSYTYVEVSRDQKRDIYIPKYIVHMLYLETWRVFFLDLSDIRVQML